MELLGDPQTLWSQSYALDISADGSIIIRTGTLRSGGDGAFIWDESNGMRTLANVLQEDFCLDPSIGEAMAGIYQGDGTIGDDAYQFGDFDADSEVNLRDFATFQRCSWGTAP